MQASIIYYEVQWAGTPIGHFYMYLRNKHQMYKVDKNIITFSTYQGEDATFPFRSKISDIEYNRLTDYNLEVWASAETYDFSPEFNFVVDVDAQDPYLGYISISGDQTIDTREDQAHIRVYGIHKITNQRKMLFAALMQIKA